MVRAAQRVKSLFDTLVDEGASSPEPLAAAHSNDESARHKLERANSARSIPSSRFCLNSSNSGRKICKEAIFSPGNEIFLPKIAPCLPYMPLGTIII